MADQSSTTGEDRFAPVQVDLKNPELAFLLAWLLPGAGHIYQGRVGKGILFMVCILFTFFVGLSMGGGRVVYARWDMSEKRLPYLCQIGVGLPAAPALYQAYRVKNREPALLLFGVPLMAPPINDHELGQLHREYGFRFEMGTLYTMIAGLLNVLVIFDAYAGPVFVIPEKEKRRRQRGNKEDPPTSADETASDTTEATSTADS
ncbi:hypothetical protein M4951_25320 [Blastopirellula sp. J2-11]|uniref:DUF6677 family protein n=1 Tax=Blastopirellula sp. J2-11 TaxID=2943192 RepID=UPI0021C86F24|nr:DUF6677 family protein [Blastopirellula sp. J2-11]UUO06651.1 hypothetical protein M4951_25320 [Blastopirellula sp. J2-11]